MVQIVSKHKKVVSFVVCTTFRVVGVSIVRYLYEYSLYIDISYPKSLTYLIFLLCENRIVC